MWCMSSACVPGTLPLKTSVTVAVIGPNFNATSTMQGNYQVSMKMISNKAEYTFLFPYSYYCIGLRIVSLTL